MRSRRLGVVSVCMLLIALGSALPVRAAKGSWDWNFNGFVGNRYVKSDDWSPFGTYSTYGLQASFGKRDEPLLFATDLYWAKDDSDYHNQTLKSEFFEFAPGFRKFWALKKRMIPWFGFGLNWIRGNYETASFGVIQKYEDDTWGAWVDGGFMFRVGGHLNLGVAVRFVAANDFSLGGEDFNGNSASVGFVVGWGAHTAGQRAAKEKNAPESATPAPAPEPKPEEPKPEEPKPEAPAEPTPPPPPDQQ
jgi:hypothetical protein